MSPTSSMRIARICQDGGGIVRRHGWHGYDAYEECALVVVAAAILISGLNQAVSAAGDLSREHAGRPGLSL